MFGLMGVARMSGQPGGAFSPLSLFAASEQGAWYDPSDFSSMFQDSAGTTPVTAVEQPVGLILDKRLGLALGPELWANGDANVSDFGGSTSAFNPATGVFANSTAGSNAGYPQLYITLPSAPAGTSYLVTANTSGDVVLNGASITTGDTGITISGQLRCIITRGSGTSYLLLSFNGTSIFSTTITNISVRELLGNHASQPTAAARPVVSARKNLLERSEEFGNAYWTKDTVTIVANAATAPDGTASADLTYPTSTGIYRYMFKGIGSAVNVGDSLTYTVCVKSAGQRWVAILSPGSGGNGGAFVDLQNGVLGEIGAGVTATIQSLGDGWYRCRLTQLAATTTAYAGVTLTDADGSYTATTSGTDGVYLWGAQLEVGSTATRYQRVTTASDYDTVGFPRYLVFDGIDDSLATAAIDFTATSKATQWAGRHSAGSATQMVYELGANVQNMFGQLIDGGAVSYAYARGNSGFAFPYAVASTTTNQIVTQTADLGSATSIGACTVRINGAAQTLVDGGTAPGGGTLGNLALYIGSRTGSTLFFSGKMYGVVIRGAESSATEIENTEAYIARKAGVVL